MPEEVIAEVLGQLSGQDRDFALAVLAGKGWVDMGLPKATF